MSGFLYFLPNERVYSHPKLAEYGLLHAVDCGVPMAFQQVMRGPEGQPGVLIGASDRWTQGDVKWSDRLKFKSFPKTHAAKQAICCWLGDEPKPTPGDLVRIKQLDGKALTLADSCSWVIPHARRWQNGTVVQTLPRTVDVDDDGAFIQGDVLPQYAKIWQHAVTYWDQLMASAYAVQAGGVGDFAIENPMQIIVDCLAANYRVSARELGILQAIDDQLVTDVLSILIDSDGMHQLEKKTEKSIGNG